MSATPDNTASTPLARGSSSGATSRAAGIEPQQLNMNQYVNSPSSTISSLTTSLTSGAQRRSRRQERRRRRAEEDEVRLADLGLSPDNIAGGRAGAANPSTPVPEEVIFDPIAAENEYDAAAYRENPGAYDSEDGMDDDEE